MEFLQSLLGGAVGAAVVGAVFKIVGEALAARRERKAKLEDRALDNADKQVTLADKFESFVKKQEQQNASMRQRMEGVEAAVKKNTDVSIANEYSAIRKEACSYIKHGSVDPLDRAELNARYARYLVLTNKGEDAALAKFLDEVGRLRPEPSALGDRKN